MMKRLFCFMLAISIMITVLLNVNGVAEENNKTNHSPKYLAGSKLSGTALKIYDFLAKEIKLIAEGKRESTIFVVPEIYKETLYRNNYDTDELFQWNIVQSKLKIIRQVSSEINDTVNDIFNALICDYPLEFFWHNNRLFEYEFSMDEDSSTTGCTNICNVTIKMKVSIDFRKTQDDEYAVDISWTKAINETLEKANAIVAANNLKTDYGKLIAYQDALATLTDYDEETWDGINQSREYGNPWQIFWVFDNDPTTKVVCEGYAKAFKLLCDLTQFNSDITALYVSGTTYDDNHAWNVVHMDDGKNYIVDITFSDRGEWASDDLFLVGYDEGDVNSGYRVEEDSFYKYHDVILKLYNADILEIANQRYLPSNDDPDYDRMAKYYISLHHQLSSNSIQQGEEYPLYIIFPESINQEFIRRHDQFLIEIYSIDSDTYEDKDKILERYYLLTDSEWEFDSLGHKIAHLLVSSTTSLVPGQYSIKVIMDKNRVHGPYFKDEKSFTVESSTRIEYHTYIGSNQTFEKGSNEDKEFIVKRSVDDNKTFSLFRRIQVDSRDVDKSNYEAKEGSVVITLKASYLETLNVGDHVMTVLFEDGKDDIPFTVSASTPIITPTVTPSVTPGITPTVEPTLKPINPSNFNDVAVPSDSFTFKKIWQGDHEDSIDFTLYKADGSVYHHGFDKRVVSKTEWRYNAYFSAPAACYVIEKPVPGYQIKYVNVGVYADVTDRCCDGGTIINKKVPKTGDAADFALWAGVIALGVVGLTTMVILTKCKRAHK